MFYPSFFPKTDSNCHIHLEIKVKDHLFHPILYRLLRRQKWPLTLISKYIIETILQYVHKKPWKIDLQG